MGTINGQLVICDLCGKQIFRKCIGEGSADGGFTQWNEFEPIPEGWGWASETGRMCPKCTAEYKSLIDSFISKVRNENEQ